MTGVLTDVDGGPDPSTLTYIVGDVFTGLLGQEAGTPWPTEHRQVVLPVTASVAVSGGWAGQVEFACSPTLARRVAAALFAMTPDEVTDDVWRQWRWEWQATVGTHTIEVRATDKTGETQTSEVSRPDPDGATGYHARTVIVR